MSMPTMSSAPATRNLTGYFTLFGYVRGQTLEELEKRIGYRPGRLTSKGALIYGFDRPPEAAEFDLRGTSIWTEQTWGRDVQPEIDEANQLAYYRNTNVPTPEQIMKRTALSGMALSGNDLPVKVYALDWQPIDDTPEGYSHASGISQWRLKRGVSIPGRLLAALAPGRARARVDRLKRAATSSSPKSSHRRWAPGSATRVRPRAASC